jgi:hypothetical protein
MGVQTLAWVGLWENRTAGRAALSQKTQVSAKTNAIGEPQGNAARAGVAVGDDRAEPGSTCTLTPSRFG